MKVLGLRGLERRENQDGPHVLMPKRLFKFVALKEATRYVGPRKKIREK